MITVQILIDLMKRVGGMLFLLLMKLLVVLSGFLMMSFMLMILDGVYESCVLGHKSKSKSYNNNRMNQLEDELSFHMLDTKAVGAIKFTRNHKTANEQRHEVEDSKDVHGNRIRAFGIEERAKSRSCT